MWPVVGADGHVRTACMEDVGSGTMTISIRTRLAATLLATSCRVGAATASVELPGRVRRLERIVKQIGDVLVPQIKKGDVDGSVVEQIVGALVRQIWEPNGERVQNSFPEQIMGVPVPQLMEAVVEVFPQERVQNSSPEQIMGVPVPQLMEAVVEVTPQECVQNRTLEQIVDVLLPQIVKERVLARKSRLSTFLCLRSRRKSWRRCRSRMWVLSCR